MIMKKNTAIAFRNIHFHLYVFSANDGTGGEHGIPSGS